ncbi:unnamed protein product [Brugia timori]|uniref:Uncharacterized protein n=1 Tax=Brugia timori TaxID=42155 RepID=A0A0R3QGL2_9BILA|nr:unnamed protein product [Brugia timori]
MHRPCTIRQLTPDEPSTSASCKYILKQEKQKSHKKKKERKKGK